MKISPKVKANTLVRFVFFPIILLRRFFLKNKNRPNHYFETFFSNVKEGSLVVSVKNIFGTFEIDARSHILQRILLNKDYEPEIVSLIEENIDFDKDAINVGANIGLFTILLAKLINKERRVLAIEPTPTAFKYLTNNIKRNEKEGKVVLYNGICSDTPGEFHLNTIAGKEEYSSLGKTYLTAEMKEEIHSIAVLGETIDNLVNKFSLNPGMLVVDVEGAEIKVLKGAKKTLEKYRPIIISELVDEFLEMQGTSAKEVVAFLLYNKYKVYDVAGNGEIQYPFCGSIIAIPKLSKSEHLPINENKH